MTKSNDLYSKDSPFEAPLIGSMNLTAGSAIAEIPSREVMPRKLEIPYVLYHELAHLKILNHSEKYWRRRDSSKGTARSFTVSRDRYHHAPWQGDFQ